MRVFSDSYVCVQVLACLPGNISNEMDFTTYCYNGGKLVNQSVCVMLEEPQWMCISMMKMASYLLPVTMSFFVCVSCMILCLQRLLVPLYVDSRVRVCVISFLFLHKHTRAGPEHNSQHERPRIRGVCLQQDRC